MRTKFLYIASISLLLLLPVANVSAQESLSDGPDFSGIASDPSTGSGGGDAVDCGAILALDINGDGVIDLHDQFAVTNSALALVQDIQDAFSNSGYGCFPAPSDDEPAPAPDSIADSLNESSGLSGSASVSTR